MPRLDLSVEERFAPTKISSKSKLDGYSHVGATTCCHPYRIQQIFV
jgi:hypothetical protein